MTDPSADIEPTDEDLPPYFHDPEADDAPESTRPEEHLEPDEDDD